MIQRWSVSYVNSVKRCNDVTFYARAPIISLWPRSLDVQRKKGQDKQTPMQWTAARGHKEPMTRHTRYTAP